MNKGIKRILLILAIGSFLTIFAFHRGDVSGTKRIIQNNELNEVDEIEQAMNVVVHHFKMNFTGCTLLDVVYDDKFQNEALYLMERDEAEKAMVLQSSFRTDHRGGDGGLNPNDTYTRWKWVLIWEVGQWRLKTWGYG